MLSEQEKKQLTEIIQGASTGYNARIEAKYDIIDYKLDGINDHLTKLNGKVVKHEKRIVELEHQNVKDVVKAENRALTCPQLTKITELEKENSGKKKVNRFVLTSLSITSLVLTILYTLTKLGVIT